MLDFVQELKDQGSSATFDRLHNSSMQSDPKYRPYDRRSQIADTPRHTDFKQTKQIKASHQMRSAKRASRQRDRGVAFQNGLEVGIGLNAAARNSGNGSPDAAHGFPSVKCNASQGGTLGDGFIRCFIGVSIKARQQAHAGEAICRLHDAHIINQYHIERVLKEELSMAEHMTNGTPTYYEDMAQIMAPIFISDGINFRSLLIAVKGALIASNKIKVLVPLFERICEISSEGVSKYWQESGMDLSELVGDLADNDVKAIEAALELSKLTSSTGPYLGYTLQDLFQRFRAALHSSVNEARLDRILKEVVRSAGLDRRLLAARAFAAALQTDGVYLKVDTATRQIEITIGVNYFTANRHSNVEDKAAPNSTEGIIADEAATTQVLNTLKILMQDKL